MLWEMTSLICNRIYIYINYKLIFKYLTLTLQMLHHVAVIIIYSVLILNTNISLQGSNNKMISESCSE